MKTVKFRIWNGMEMVYEVTAGKFGTFYVNPEKGDGLNPRDTACLTENTTKYPENTPLMQYTGVNDINNKEIYEGDIVRFQSWRDALQRMEDKVMEVKYSGGFFSPLVSFGDYSPVNRNYEVIGNIHDNPEPIK